MERNWFERASARLSNTKFERYVDNLYAYFYGGGIPTYSIILITILATGVSVYYSLVYDWLPDYRNDPIFLLEVPLFFSRYTILAGFLLAYFDTTSFFVGEVASIFFSFILATFLIHYVKEQL